MKTFAYCSYLICTTVQAYLWNYELAMSLLLILFLADTFTWIIKYFRLWRLKSKGMWYGTISKAFMLIIPMLLDIAISLTIFSEYRENVWAATITVLVIAELISIIQNIKVIRTWVEETEQDVITKLLEWMLAIGNIVLENTVWRLQDSVNKVFKTSAIKDDTETKEQPEQGT